MAIENSKTGEIDKLKSPLKYDDLKVYDSKGSQINCIETLSDLKFIIEPDPNILSEEEILEYAPSVYTAFSASNTLCIGIILYNFSLYGNSCLLWRKWACNVFSLDISYYSIALFILYL